MVKTVVILGGSLGGLHIAHALLRKNDKDLKIILVSKNSHFFWNLASVRAIIPGQIKDDDIFKPLSTILSRYPSERYELIIGTATSADFDAKKVDVTVTSDNSSISIVYDHLVLATGARCPQSTVPWKAANTYEELHAQLHMTAERVAAAQHIVVAGAGTTGIEVAGELGAAFGTGKQIVLLASGDKLLNGDIVAAAAASELKNLNVTVRYNARVADAKPSKDGAKTEITLKSGETLFTDLYLPTMGLVPNSEYVPTKYLGPDPNSKTVQVDEYLRVPGAEGVWAVGDIVSKPRAGFFITQKQAATVAKNIDAVLAGREPVLHKGPPVDILACAVGPKRGAGRMNSIRLPSFGVWLAKSRTLGMQMISNYVDGSVA